MAQERKTWIVASVILLVLLFCSKVYFLSKPEKECEVCKSCPECENCQDTIGDKAIVDVMVSNWAENLYDPSEMFFDYWVMNYGDVEAKNINVKCKLFDEYDNMRTSVTGYYGNLASRSAESKELVTGNIDYKPGEKFVPVCYVESCDNCEILYKRIPSIVESYEY